MTYLSYILSGFIPWIVYIQWRNDPALFQVFYAVIVKLITHPIALMQESVNFWGLEGIILLFYPVFISL